MYHQSYMNENGDKVYTTKVQKESPVGMTTQSQPESTSSSTSNPSASSQYMYPASTYFPLPFHLQNADPAVQQTYLPPSQLPPSVKIPGVAPTFTVPAPVATGMYSLPQFQQAQQLFQRDAQTITPEALESVKAALASSEVEHKSETKKKAIPRKAAGQSWEDPTLSDWPENDFRLFCGDLGNEVNDDVLSKSFSRFPSFNMARVVRDKRTGKTKGYGFVSFSNPSDLAAAIKEMNGKYVGNRPIKLRKSTWKERTDADALERQKNHIQKKPKLQKKGILHK
ncbi:RNA-binding protein 42 [Canna indica]|uniref:RNA-binding protein 42 n=1 Tax=Canna indica TaxID=4628 RepID=A0AAQ3JYF3_9LILI|nr:RNA-binding protein 42 [Canna indica]